MVLQAKKPKKTVKAKKSAGKFGKHKKKYYLCIAIEIGLGKRAPSKRDWKVG